MIKTKRFTAILLMAIMVSMVFGVLAPATAFASGRTDTEEATSNNMWDDFGVSVNGDSLEVKTGAGEDSWETLIEKYQGFITGVAAVGAVTMVVLFIIQFLKLGASAGNPSARSQAMVGVLWTGLAAAGLGAVALITGIFYGAINSAG